MHKLLQALLCTFIGIISIAAQNPYQEIKYNADDPNLPPWVQLMYGEDPNLIEIQDAYEAYYNVNKFVKNQYTQYYKRWLRDKWQYMRQDGTLDIPSTRLQEKQLASYLRKVATQKSKHRSPTSAWEEIGPWEYDHEKAMDFSVQSPGSAHVYAMEQSVSNPNIVWAGTANAGLWKSTDKGLTWACMTTDEIIKSSYSQEIDHSNADIVYAYGNNKIWKTSDGGINWTATGNDQYFSWTRDIKMHPSNTAVLLAATTDGLYRTTENGNSWIKLKGGHWQELEWHPADNNIVYAVKQISNRTELYKSTDGGLTFSIRTNGWPGIVSNNSTGPFNSNEIDINAYASFANVDLGSVSIPNFTIELRVKLDNWSGDPSIISNKNWNNGNNDGFILASNGTGWKFNIGDGNSRIDLNGGSINDNEWHHIAVTYGAAGDKKVFQDGALINSTSNTISTSIASGLALRMMQDGTGSYGSNLAGNLAEVRIWSTALTDAQIGELVCSPVDNTHPNYGDLLHHWKIDEGSGNTFNDSKGSNTGTISGSNTWHTDNEMVCLETNHFGGENKRTEIAVSLAAPNNLYVLSSGSANGSSGLYGFYKSLDSGENFTYTCCGTDPGGIPSVGNPNVMGYAYDLTSTGGQYYYDMSLAVSPTDPDKIFAAGISVIRSEDGGATWETNGHWVTWVGPNTKQRYTHADVHDVKFFLNGGQTDLWTASDGGLFYSANQGDNFEPRMHGIQGTEFWGFGGSYKEDAMIGGTYHNGTLLHYNDVYQKGKNGKGGWIALGAADQTFGYVHDADGSKMFHESGLRKVTTRDQYWKWLPFDNNKIANYSGQPGRYGNYEWHPYYYDEYYTPRDSVLYKTEDDGATWTLVYDFGLGDIYRLRIPAGNPEVIYVIQAHYNLGKRLWKSTDAGNTFSDITPSDVLTGSNNWRHKNFDIDHDNPDNIWLLLTGNANGFKVFHTTDGGASWSNITTPMLDNEYMLDISHHQGTDGGVYIGTGNTVFYKNNTMLDWELFNNNLPLLTRCGYLYPYYTAGKIRVGTYRGAYQADFYEDAAPTARVSVDKKSSHCSRDTFYFKDLSYVEHDNVSWLWTFENGIPATSTEENPKVLFSDGSHDVTLTVTNDYGSATIAVEDMVSIEHGCDMDAVPGNKLTVDGSDNSYAIADHHPTLNFTSTDYTLTMWIKTKTTAADAFIIGKKDWDSGINPGWVLAMQNGKLWFNMSDGTNRIDLVPNLLINDGEWHHIAISVDRSATAQMYLDGIEIGSIDVHAVGNMENELFLGLGADCEMDWNIAAEIEEVALYTTALSRHQIRASRHLTKTDTTADLQNYYQFNEASGPVQDKKSIHHFTLGMDASRTLSNCPIGGGNSQKMVLNTGGIADYDQVDVLLELPGSGTYPDGEVYITKIKYHPDTSPSSSPISKSYWVVNNYGNNTIISDLSSIQFTNIEILTPGVQANDFKLYKRADNADGNTWIDIDNADIIDSNTGNITFSTGMVLTEMGQFVLTNESAVGWIGVVSTEWDNKDNWGEGIVPSLTADVIIPAHTPYQPIVNINAQIHSILLMEGATIGVDTEVIFEVRE